MEKERRIRKGRGRIAGMVFLLLLLLLAVGALVVIKLFTVDKVIVSGNTYYSQEAVEEWLLDDEYSWNSLYVFFKYKFQAPRELAFVDSVDVSLDPPHTLKITVHEKELMGDRKSVV